MNEELEKTNQEQDVPNARYGDVVHPENPAMVGNHDDNGKVIESDAGLEAKKKQLEQKKEAQKEAEKPIEQSKQTSFFNKISDFLFSGDIV